jgi:protein gp37
VLTRRNRVFTCSWSDWFIEEADMWRPDAWDIVRQRPDLTFQILTKRPERIRESLPRDWGAGWENVWLGVSVENQKAGKTRIPLLAKVPARVRFLSVEPLLERVTPLFWPLQSLSWVIVGGESGSATESRACEVQWVRDVVRQCKDIGVPVFVKQLGSSWARDTRCPDTHGGDPNYWPVDLRVREFPETIDATR